MIWGCVGVVWHGMDVICDCLQGELPDCLGTICDCLGVIWDGVGVILDFLGAICDFLGVWDCPGARSASAS